MYSVTRWISPQDLGHMAYSDYWNDEAEEAKKPFAVDLAAQEAYVADFRRDLDLALSFAGRAQTVLDLACGTAWAAPSILKITGAKKIYCVEYSVHRIEKIAPAMLAGYGVDPGAVELVLGSFYDIKLPNKSVDLITMCQAFHHAEKPGALLAECRRVLKPGGIIIITGEMEAERPFANWVKRSIWMIRQGKMPVTRLEDIYDVDQVLGDHVYCDAAYKKMFKRFGYTYEKIPSLLDRNISWKLTRDASI